MNIQILVDKAYAGPTLCELEPILEDLADPVEARWTGSKQDYLFLERYPTREFTLYAQDHEAQERAIWILGGSLPMSQEDLTAAKEALKNADNQTWRLRVDGLGHARGTLLLTKVVADSLRNGKRPQAACSVAINCLMDRVHPADADVLMRLRAAR